MRFMRMTGRLLRVFLLFTLSTVMFYYGMIWVNQEYENYQRYNKPEGAAVKVAADGQPDDWSWWDRLVWFTFSGE
ncbi:YqzK family protein [Bacillus fonticola]|uniref:YqzK family protein n=1 Tax=Bacillus fonticola TaxID=2728853 RepID=UPI001472C625|nr:YqzK family protein [Bacillus fonticola]